MSCICLTDTLGVNQEDFDSLHIMPVSIDDVKCSIDFSNRVNEKQFFKGLFINYDYNSKTKTELIYLPKNLSEVVFEEFYLTALYAIFNTRCTDFLFTLSDSDMQFLSKLTLRYIKLKSKVELCRKTDCYTLTKNYNKLEGYKSRINTKIKKHFTRVCKKRV